MELNYILKHNFQDDLIKMRPRSIGGIQYVFRFKNGYGASVVKGEGSYGGEQDLWELAVLKFDGDEYDLDYDTEITNDVEGYLTDEDVGDLLRRIKAL